jgi:hypothetical protein
MKVTKKANILVLPGIKKEDFISIDDLFENRLLQTVGESDFSVENTTFMYDKIPLKFYNVALWPKSTNLKCWNCTRKFNTMPLFIPSRILSDDLGEEYFDVKGNFCTINCAYSYAHIFKESDSVDVHSRLLLLYEKMFNTRIIKIPLSPNKEELIEYGGLLTGEEYEKEIVKRNNEQNLNKFKLEHYRFETV